MLTMCPLDYQLICYSLTGSIANTVTSSLATRAVPQPISGEDARFGRLCVLDDRVTLALL
jgi:hypothetical protein